MHRSTFIRCLLAGTLAPSWIARAIEPATPKKLVLIAGRPSHPPGMHEFRAGTLLLEKRLQDVPGLVVERHDGGWVQDESTLEDAAALVIFSDGGGGHPAVQRDRLKLLERRVQAGMGIGMMHYAVEVPPDRGGPEFRRWIGGAYEHEYSCNPIWKASFEQFPDHPITRGVRPFSIEDEWYFNMRFAEGWDGLEAKTVGGVRHQPILSARPSDTTRDGPYVYPRGPYPHIQAAKGRNETLLWAVERPEGSRGFGFTGGHFHKNWQDDNFRRVILNALCWVTGVPVPEQGVESSEVSDEEIQRNLDPK